MRKLYFTNWCHHYNEKALLDKGGFEFFPALGLTRIGKDDRGASNPDDDALVAINVFTDSALMSSVDALAQESYLAYGGIIADQLNKYSDSNEAGCRAYLEHRFKFMQPLSSYTLHVAPLMIVPLYNNRLDPDHRNWDMYEHEGYLYGKDKRTGKCYEVKRRRLVFDAGNVFGRRYRTVDMYTINNEDSDLLTLREINASLPMDGEKFKSLSQNDILATHIPKASNLLAVELITGIGIKHLAQSTDIVKVVNYEQ